MNARPKKVLITGAQTGGHLIPATVVGHALQELKFEVTLVTSGQNIEQNILASVSLPVITFSAPKLKGMGLWRTARGFSALPSALLRAIRLVQRVGPSLVVGFGGYTTGPIVLASSLARIPSAVCEQNSIPGLTNRFLGRFVDRIFLTYEQSLNWFPRHKCSLTGTPVRNELLKVPEKTYESDERNILVFGGSQGAHFLNTQIPPVLALLAKKGMVLKVLHQTGEGREEQVQRAYMEAGVQAKVVAYIHEMEAAYRFADFVICRAGAGTVSELTAIGIPALFVPFAKASDNHQVFNAKPVVEAGAGFLVEEKYFDAGKVAEQLFGVLKDKDTLRRMARAARAIGRRDALDKIVSTILELGGWKWERQAAG